MGNRHKIAVGLVDREGVRVDGRTEGYSDDRLVGDGIVLEYMKDIHQMKVN